MFSVFLFFLIVNEAQSLSNSQVTLCVESNYIEKIKDHWESACTENEDNTLNITLNGNFTKSLSFDLVWFASLPYKIKSLTIENVQTLDLNITYRSDHNLTYFSHLEVRNIKNVTVVRAEKPSLSLVPSDVVIFKNIESLNLESLCNGKSQCSKWGSLKIINATVDHLPKNLLGEKPGLAELLIDDSTILKADDDAISLENKQAVIRLTNSKLNLISRNFLKCKAEKLIVTGNTFKNLSTKAFDCEVDKFIFNDNVVEHLFSWPPNRQDSSHVSNLSVRSPEVNIHGNIFKYIGRIEFYGNKEQLYQLNSHSMSFNFSANEIHLFDPKTFLTSEDLLGQYYHSYNIYNNSIDCSCQSASWFLRMLHGKDWPEEYHPLSFAWMNNNNPNKCFNIPNCTLNQVAYDIFRLCQKNYECPINVPRDADVNLSLTLKTERDWKRLEKTDGENGFHDAIEKWLKKLEFLMAVKEENTREFGHSSQISTNPSTGADNKITLMPLLILISSLNLILTLLLIGVILFKTKCFRSFFAGHSLEKDHEPVSEMRYRTLYSLEI